MKSYEASESSAIISLQELMRIEEQRLHQEEAERIARLEAKRQAEEAHRARQQQEQAAREEEERREREARARREREETARVEAMRQALIEQERIKAERQALQDQEALRLAHEREQARILQQSDARKLRRLLLGVSLGAAAVIAGGLGLYLGKIRPEAEARAAQAAQATREAQQRLDEYRASSATNEEEVARLQRLLHEARTPKQQASVQQEIKNLPRTSPHQPPSPAPVRTPTPASKAPCPVGDPLCY